MSACPVTASTLIAKASSTWQKSFTYDPALQCDAIQPIVWPIAEGGNGNSYLFSSLRLTWQEAKLAAEQAGGHLWVINSRAEEEFVRTLLENNDIWIGTTDESEEGTWIWVTGETGATQIGGMVNPIIQEGRTMLITATGLIIGTIRSQRTGIPVYM